MTDDNDVTIITTSEFTNGKVKEDVYLHTDFGKIRYVNKKKIFGYFTLLYWTLYNVLQNELVICTSLFAPSSIITIIFSVFLKKKLIISPRGELFDTAIGKSRIKTIFIYLFRFVLKNNRIRLHATSNSERDIILKRLGAEVKVSVISNFIEFPQFIERSGEFNYFVYLGRISSIKAIENLIIAIDNDEFKSSGYRLIVVGCYDNEYGRMLIKMVQNRNLCNIVEFKGEITGPGKYEVLANAYFTIVPSHSENFCNVVLESLHQGTPVIASRGTPWDILEVHKIGYWTSNIPENLADTINKSIVLKKQEYDQMRIRSSQFARSQFDPSLSIQVWRKLINSIE
jgi:glycosyltransferase involved in cell wall biosynthesis